MDCLDGSLLILMIIISIFYLGIGIPPRTFVLTSGITVVLALMAGFAVTKVIKYLYEIYETYMFEGY